MPEIQPADPEERLPTGTVRVWSVDLDASSAGGPSVLDVLDGRELERASRFATPLLRERWGAGRRALRIILGGILGRSPNRVPLVESESGKPALDLLPPGGLLGFNVAHAAGLALIAASWGRRVGIDVEIPRAIPEAADLVNRFFNEREQAAFHALDPKRHQAAFFALWTRKEAFAKATGRGITDSLGRFSVTVDPDAEPALEWVEWPEERDVGWTLRTLATPPGFVAALAADGAPWHLERHLWSP